jgi:hypothetical protein
MGMSSIETMNQMKGIMVWHWNLKKKYYIYIYIYIYIYCTYVIDIWLYMNIVDYFYCPFCHAFNLDVSFHTQFQVENIIYFLTWE